MADITLSYKGSTIAEVSASGTTKLNTKGKFCEDDISLQYEKRNIQKSEWDRCVDATRLQL